MSTQRQNQAKPSSPSSALPVQTSLFQQRSLPDSSQEADEALPSSYQPHDLQTQLERASRFGHNFSQVQVQTPPSAVIQPQMERGKSEEQEDDREVDSVAESVKRMAPPGGDPSQGQDQEEEAIQTMPLLGVLSPRIQRQDQEEEAIQTMPLLGVLSPRIQRQDQEEELVQMMPHWGKLQRLPQEEDDSSMQMMPQWGVIQRQEPESAQEAIQMQWLGPKLVVGAPGDKYEQEADSMAAQVMSMSAPPTIPESIQRQGEEEEQESLVQKSPLADSITPLVQRQTEEKEEQIQAKSLLQRASAKGNNDAGSGLENKLTSSKGGGSPLPDNVRSFMEPRFGSDFSSVRVHTDSTAVQMNKELHAQAFAHGNDIYYGAGKSPGADALTAHELTHTIQQTGGVQAKSVTQWVKKENKVQAKAISAPSSEGQPTSQLKEKPQQQTGKNNQAQPIKPASTAATADKSGQKEVKRQTPAAKEDTAAKSQKEGSDSKATAKQSVTKLADSGSTSDSAAEGGGAKSPTSPQDDPAFQAVVNKAKGVAGEKKKHDPAKAESKEAQDAAEPPANEVESKAQDKQVGEMNQQQPGEFNAEAFKAALMEKIAAVIPNNEEDAKKFKDSNQIDSVKQDMSSQVTQEQEQAAGPIEEKTKEAPDTSGIEPKPVTPLQPPEAGSPQTDIGAQKAAPKPKPESEVSQPLKANSQELDQQMAEAHLTEEQLEKSNEPQFQEALGVKKEAQANAVEAPQAYRQDEKATLNKAQTEAQATSQTQLQGMHGERKQLLAQVMGAQSETQGKDTQERAKIANPINGIYEKTKGEVETVLNGIDGQVTSKFDAGAATAKQKFETYVGQKMEAWEQERYGEWYDVTGLDERISDAWNGLPPEVNQFFVDGRQLYLNSMDVALSGIANFVAQKLNDAKQKIAEGKQKIQEYVAGLPENLRQVGQEAAQNIQGKFDQLEESVNSKQDELIDTLAQKYSENLQQIDAEIEKRKEENRGLKDKAKDAIAGTIQTIMQLKDMLMGVLAKAASAIDKIILDPIAFLGNLISGIKQGFDKFAGNIEKHLQKGLMGWLMGALAGAGITMPESFDLKGIFSLVMQVLGVVYDGIKSRVIKALGKNGEKMFAALESNFEMFVILKNEGIAGLWQFLQDKIGDLKVMVIDTIKTFVVENVIKAGVLWVVSLLNPASAFVKACKAIYDIIMFFIERGSQIAQLVNAVTDSVGAIASGAIGGAAALIENALGTSLPVVISFMASLLGLGGISEKIGGIIKQVRAPIDKAIDWLIAQAVQFSKKIGKAFGFGKDEKGKDGKDNKEGKLEDSEVGKTVNFSAASESHRLWINAQGTSTTVMVASTPTPVETKLNEWQGKVDSLPEDKRPQAQSLLATARQHLGKTEQEAQTTAKEMQEAKQNSTDEAAIAEAEQADNQTETAEQNLADVLQQLFKLFGEKQDLTVVYAQQLEQADPNAQSILKAHLTGDANKLKDLHNWVDVKKFLGSQTNVEAMLETPLNIEHTFGVRASQDQAKPAVTAALAANNMTEKDIGGDIDKYIRYRKQFIHAGTASKSELAKQVFEKANKGNATQALQQDFTAKLKGDKYAHLNREDIRKELEKAAGAAEAGWVAVFATGGTQLKGKTPKGEEYGLTLAKVWNHKKRDLGEVVNQVRTAITQTIKADKNFQKNHLREKKPETYAQQIAAELVKHISQKELYFVKHTDIPRNLVEGPHMIRNPEFSANQAKYKTIAANAKEKALSDLTGEVHHVIPLYLGGGSELGNLMVAEGGAAVEESAHNAMHQFIDELEIGEFLDVKDKITLDWTSLGGTFPDDMLKIIIGTVKQDGSIQYKETALTYKVEQDERGTL